MSEAFLDCEPEVEKSEEKEESVEEKREKSYLGQLKKCKIELLQALSQKDDLSDELEKLKAQMTQY